MKRSLNNRAIVLVLDLCLCALGFILADWIQYTTSILPLPTASCLIIGLVFLVSCLLSFGLFKSYRGLIRHSNIREVWRIFGSLLVAGVLTLASMHLVEMSKGPSTFFILNTVLFCFFLILAFRLMIVYLYNRLKSTTYGKRKRTIIFGIGPHSLALANWINRSSHSIHSVQGFITREKDARKTRIQDLPVFYLNGDNLDWFLSKYEVTTILFPSYQSVRNEQAFIATCVDMGLTVLVSPPLEGIETSGITRLQMKPIQLEDLLEREEIKLDMERIAYQSENKTILITGAAGSIGSEMVRQLAHFNPKTLLLFDMAETPLHNLQLEMEKSFPTIHIVPLIGDVRSETRVEGIFRIFKPDIVYHAAAYKHVPMMEENPCEAILVNVLGTRRVCDAALRHGVETFVFISTDKAVKPASVVGASKRLAEWYVQSVAAKMNKQQDVRILITRFGNVLGSNGSVITRFRKQIEDGGPVTVAHPDIQRYFMTIPEATRLVLEAASFGENGGVYVFEMGQPIRIAELARKMIELAGYTPDKDIAITYCGMQPGEKMVEQQTSDGEEPLSTEHDYIKTTHFVRHQYEEVATMVDQVVALSETVQIEAVITLLKQLIPDFKPSSTHKRLVNV
jgi:FlaA1/EpsC-like NDP-sugar epimerase